MGGLETAKINYENWLKDPYFDAETHAELEKIKEDEKEITERFYTDLEFGTAGLRGIIGAGTNRINKYTVRKATQGLANFIIKEKVQDKGVLIGHDSRRFSPEFALETALCLAANGIKAYLFEDLRPTPEISFAIRYLGCTAGVNITASHNPAKYNGYKAYWADGAQITPPYDTGIMEQVKAVESYSSCKTTDKESAIKAGLLTIVGKEIDDAYIAQLKKQIKSPEAIKQYASKLKIVYTPLHGAGNIPVRRILSELGFNNVWVVPEQEQPDGDFPTLPYPNPEADQAFDLAIALAKNVKADIVLATDPDSDRLGVRVRDAKGEYHTLTGNLSGAFLADYELSRISEKSGIPADGKLISTIVSGKMGKSIANHYGADYVEVLTGFKYIGEQIRKYEETGKGTYLFGYEESYGCLIGTYARDKDAVVASMALCEAAAYYASKGMNMWDAVVALFEKYGYFDENVISLTFEGIEGKQKMQEIMETLRAGQPAAIGSFSVLAKRDYKLSKRTLIADGTTEDIDLPSSNVIYYELQDDAWCAVRPSGTEPKIKLYYGIKGQSFEDAEKLKEKLGAALTEFVGV